jgi:transcriptional regulator with XRE-family HTH domain
MYQITLFPSQENKVTKIKKGRKHNTVFGPFIRKLRKEKFPGMTVAEFAETVGITGPYLSNIENCKVPPPSDAIAKEIAAKLGEDVDIVLAMAGYVDPEVAAKLGTVENNQFDILKIIKFTRGAYSGSAKFTTEQFVAYLIGRTIEERKKLATSEILPELIHLVGYFAKHEDRFFEEFKPTIERGLSILGPILDQIESQSK